MQVFFLHLLQKKEKFSLLNWFILSAAEGTKIYEDDLGGCQATSRSWQTHGIRATHGKRAHYTSTPCTHIDKGTTHREYDNMNTRRERDRHGRSWEFWSPSSDLQHLE